MIEDTELIRRALEVVNPRRLSPLVEVASVGAALSTDKGNIYVGVCIDTACSLGACAERVAIGNMITHGESRIVSIVAVNRDQKVLPPCGVCRELICQVDEGNRETRILLGKDKARRLQELLPEHWRDTKI